MHLHRQHFQTMMSLRLLTYDYDSDEDTYFRKFVKIMKSHY